MASISTNSKGERRILFNGRDGKRKALYLGKVPKSFAREVKGRVEAILLGGENPDTETTAWLNNKIDDVLHAKIAATGLVTPRQSANGNGPKLGAFTEAHIAKRRAAGTKARTLINLQAARRFLVGCFGADRDMRTITPNDADEFKLYMQGKGYAQATIGRQIKHAKYFFRVALRSRVIPDNPFADVKAPAQTNEKRKVFIPLEDAYKVIDACPDCETRLLFALSRFGGLRCPSETLNLKWSDVDWERNRFWASSPKTEHHEGKEGRWVPIFPELRPYLDEAYHQTEEGEVYVITKYRSQNKNFRTRFNRIIRRAGLEPWTKTFHNLRASRETELAQRFPIHVVCAWIGNSALIAQKHYLQITEADFEKASAPDDAAWSGTSSTDPQTEIEPPQKSEDFDSMQLDATFCGDGSYARRDSNPQPTVPKTVALSS